MQGSTYTYTYATLGELAAWLIGWDLLAGLGAYTWIRLGIWIVIGLVIYFLYGRFQSRLRAE